MKKYSFATRSLQKQHDLEMQDTPIEDLLFCILHNRPVTSLTVCAECASSTNIAQPTPGGVKYDVDKPDLSTTAPSQSRKDSPVFSGVLMYFPDAIMEISRHSKKGNDKHNPGQPLHWAKQKSKDHADCIARHLIDIGPNWDELDEETDSYHATALAWRALALLQTLLERSRK